MSLGMIIGAADAVSSAILYLVLLGGAFGWLFWSRTQLELTPEQSQLDPLITRQFLAGGVYYPENQKRVRPWRAQAWMGLLVAAPSLFLLLGGLLQLFALQHGLAARGDALFPAVVTGYLPAAVQLVFVLALISALFPSADGALTALTALRWWRLHEETQAVGRS